MYEVKVFSLNVVWPPLTKCIGTCLCLYQSISDDQNFYPCFAAGQFSMHASYRNSDDLITRSVRLPITKHAVKDKQINLFCSTYTVLEQLKSIAITVKDIFCN